MKLILKKIKAFFTQDILNRIYRVESTLDRSYSSIVTIQQKQIFISFANPSLKVDDFGFSIFCESNEDGMILGIFSVVGFKNKILVDIGAGSGLEGSNTANLLLHHGFDGLLIEGNNSNAENLRAIYQRQRQTRHYPPRVINSLVTADNINALIKENGISGEIDLLSIDIDSIDYWVWDALETIRPRVVVVEYQCILPEHVSLSVPQDFEGTVFETYNGHQYGVYNSASLKAFEKLASKKGYRLVATSRLGYNAIFILNELGVGEIKTISVKEGLDRPFVRWAQNTFYEKTKLLKWTEV